MTINKTWLSQLSENARQVERFKKKCPPGTLFRLKGTAVPCIKSTPGTVLTPEEIHNQKYILPGRGDIVMLLDWTHHNCPKVYHLSKNYVGYMVLELGIWTISDCLTIVKD